MDTDLLFIIVILSLIIIIGLLLIYINTKENKKMRQTKERFDLEKITKSIERDYKPVNINLTSFEQEQENNAIISYQELIKQKHNNNSISYDTSYVNDDDLDIKKIDVDNEFRDEEKKVSNNNTGFSLMNYEKEEEFLKALKQLQGTLVR
jgi:hypothetical protein